MSPTGSHGQAIFRYAYPNISIKILGATKLSLLRAASDLRLVRRPCKINLGLEFEPHVVSQATDFINAVVTMHRSGRKVDDFAFQGRNSFYYTDAIAISLMLKFSSNATSEKCTCSSTEI